MPYLHSLSFSRSGHQPAEVGGCGYCCHHAVCVYHRGDWLHPLPIPDGNRTEDAIYTGNTNNTRAHTGIETPLKLLKMKYLFTMQMLACATTQGNKSSCLFVPSQQFRQSAYKAWLVEANQEEPCPRKSCCFSVFKAEVNSWNILFSSSSRTQRFLISPH